MAESRHRCKNLVLDAGPLLSLSPLRGLAETYLTVPQVLDELKDRRAREHFERLGLAAGVRVDVRSPDAASISQVVQFAKKTGDYAVLSHADICVLALTHSIHQSAAASDASSATPRDGCQSLDTAGSSSGTVSVQTTPRDENNKTETAPGSTSRDVQDAVDGDVHAPPTSHSEDDSRAVELSHQNSEPTIYEDPSDEDDGEGEWVTPQTVTLHKSRALALLPSSGSCVSKRGNEQALVLAGCMTGDFAVQNVLLQMGLTLVGSDGQRIQRMKSWVLRCHACFKICKDNSKQFCPSCGNPTLMRTSVTIASPNASLDAPAMQVHLKKNYQYKVRGTKYSIPAPKPGSAKTGPGEGLILREDQLGFTRAKKRADGKREREEQRMIKGLVDRGGKGGVSVGRWSDPDWMPGMLGVGTGGPGRSLSAGGGMPQIGHGKKNPNATKR